MNGCTFGALSKPDKVELWREPLDRPLAFRNASIAEPVVQAIWARLPKLDGARPHAIASPERRQRNGLTFVLETEFLHAPVKFFAGPQHLALPGSPRANLAQPRPAVIVKPRF